MNRIVCGRMDEGVGVSRPGTCKSEDVYGDGNGDTSRRYGERNGYHHLAPSRSFDSTSLLKCSKIRMHQGPLR